MFGQATGPHQRRMQREQKTLPTGVNRPKREADHSHACNAVVMNECRYTYNPSTSHHDGPKDNVMFFPGIYLKGQRTVGIVADTRPPIPPPTHTQIERLVGIATRLRAARSGVRMPVRVR